MRLRKSSVLIIGLAASVAGLEAKGQRTPDPYPSRPVRLIVPFAPGGGTDAMARVFGQKFSDSAGQTVVVDNRAGGGGTIGAEMTVRAAPDGYTLCMVSTSYATNAAMFKLAYDPIRDITPIALLGDAGILLTLHPSVAARSVKELIALAKAKPGALNYGSSGTGGNTHLATELLNITAGTRMTHVPYKGTGPALTDLLAGNVQLSMSPIGVMLPHVKSGRLRGLAVSSVKRNSAIPDVPAIAETLPGYEATLWYGLWGPKGLPTHVVSLWNSEARKAAQSPDLKQRFVAEGIDAADGPPDLFRDVVLRDVTKWIKVVQTANIKTIQ